MLLLISLEEMRCASEIILCKKMYVSVSSLSHGFCRAVDGDGDDGCN